MKGDFEVSCYETNRLAMVTLAVVGIVSKCIAFFLFFTAQTNNQGVWSVSEQTNEVYQQIMENKVCFICNSCWLFFRVSKS